MNRRDLLKCLAAGGAVVAGELWVPGRKLISIPSGRVFDGVMLNIRGENIALTTDGFDRLQNDELKILEVYAHFWALN